MPIFLNLNVIMTMPANFDEIIQQNSDAYRTLIASTGEDLTREGLLNTPERAAKAFSFLTQGYHQDLVEITNNAIFPTDNNELVMVKNIEFYSMCEHHMLPFYGKAHVAYIPNGVITGLSKIARVVDAYSRRLQVQERLTTQILNVIQETLNPLGVAVVIEASHLCMMMRGVEKQNSYTTTSTLLGDFRNPATRTEFFNLIK